MDDRHLIDLRREYLLALHVTAAASARATSALEASASARSVIRDHVRSGGSVRDIEHLIETNALRANVSAALEDLERARHQSLRLLYQLLHAEGETMTEIGRSWGISRQLVSRLINEPNTKRP